MTKKSQNSAFVFLSFSWTRVLVPRQLSMLLVFLKLQFTCGLRIHLLAVFTPSSKADAQREEERQSFCAAVATLEKNNHKLKVILNQIRSLKSSTR